MRRNSLSRALFPSWMFSSRFSFLNQERILFRASLVRTMPSQSRLGPLPRPEAVSTSTIIPVLTLKSRLTIRPSTLAPIIRLPTAEWMA